MSNTYFTADLHFGHDLVARHRGFDETKDHDLAVIKGLIEGLTKGSTLWVLGDIVGRGDDREYALDLLSFAKEGRGLTVHLVTGNHDTCSPMHRTAHKEQAKYLRVFDSVQPFAKVRYNRQDVLLSHYPYLHSGDRGEEERYQQWRLPNLGERLIHGHTHQGVPYDPARLNQVCVSWDAWGRPATLHETMQQLEVQEGTQWTK